MFTDMPCGEGGGGDGRILRSAEGHENSTLFSWQFDESLTRQSYCLTTAEI